jgi:Protein of unknown function (DUF3631)
VTAPAVPVPTVDLGVELLDDVHAWLTSYVAFPSTHAATAVTLWAAHTHLVDGFESTPRLALVSPEPECGKTRVLELLELICRGAETLSHASAPYIFRRVAAAHRDDYPEHVSVLIDECDAIWKGGDDTAEALRSVVNSGHRRGAHVGRVEMAGQVAKLIQFPVYAPVALASKGDHIPETILTRSVIVRMRRRAPDEYVRGFRQRVTRPEGLALHDRLTDWADSVRDRIGCAQCWPEMPEGVTDRPADVWEPLLTVAALVGGDWPQRARDACLAFIVGARDDTVSAGIRLLGDLHGVFGVHEVMATETILNGLHKLDEAPWRDWYGHPLNPRELAKLLKPYGVSSTKVRIGEASVRGYRREDLWDPWHRYGVLSNLSGTSGTSGTPLIRHVPDVPHVPDQRPEARDSSLLDDGCRVCGERMDPDLMAEGDDDTHPGCEPGEATPDTEQAQALVVDILGGTVLRREQ